MKINIKSGITIFGVAVLINGNRESRKGQQQCFRAGNDSQEQRPIIGRQMRQARHAARIADREQRP